jgi:hypothetical protein
VVNYLTKRKLNKLQMDVSPRRSANRGYRTHLGERLLSELIRYRVIVANLCTMTPATVSAGCDATMERMGNDPIILKKRWARPVGKTRESDILRHSSKRALAMARLRALLLTRTTGQLTYSHRIATRMVYVVMCSSTSLCGQMHAMA